MPVADLPDASLDSLLPLLASGGKALLALLDRSGGYDHIDDLLPSGDDPAGTDYSWFRVIPEDRHAMDTALDVGTVEQAIAVVGVVDGEPRAWLLDELDTREPEDVIALLDDHARAMEDAADEDW